MSEPTLLVRADASPSIGNGHVMRSLSLARQWRTAGGQADFAGRISSEPIRQLVRAGCRQLVELPEDRDLPLADLTPRPPEWVALDGYELGAQVLDGLREAGCRTLWIDDQIANPPHPVDLLLNQNVGSMVLAYPPGLAETVLLGPKFCLLRPEFLQVSPEKRDRRAGPLRILVSFGGADPKNVTELILGALRDVPLPLEVRVVVGPLNPHAPRIHQTALPEWEVAVHPPQLIDWMRQADLAICAGGGTCLELAYLGTPIVLVTQADNQWQNARGLQESGAALWLGDVEGFQNARLVELISELAANRERLDAMGAAGRSLVDGLGAQRVVRLMQILAGANAQDGLLFRQCTTGDVYDLWRLANDPGVRANSFTPDSIPLQDHQRWFQSRINSSDDALFVLDLHGLVVGQVRYTRSDQAELAQVHFALHRAFRGRGWGTRALIETRLAAIQALGVSAVEGLVLPENAPSKRSFLKAGYQKERPRFERGQECEVFLWRS